MTLSNPLCAAWAVDFMAALQVMVCVPNALKMLYGGSNLHQQPVQQLQLYQVPPQVGIVRAKYLEFISFHALTLKYPVGIVLVIR